MNLDKKTDQLAIEVDIKDLMTNQRARNFKRAIVRDLKKRASYAVLVVAMLSAIGPTISICASDPPPDESAPDATASEAPSSDSLKSLNVADSLNKQQGADLLTLQTFQTSPFVSSGGTKSGYIETKQTFEALERDLSISANYSLFQQAADHVMTQTGFCTGLGAAGSSPNSPNSSGDTSYSNNPQDSNNSQDPNNP
ncbi:MAG: hypothetical protein J0653_05340, partial [Deltaproteobacteria bacterium]|nr:hypothetical protein [Deltaproteobacteria bacterium]